MDVEKLGGKKEELLLLLGKGYLCLQLLRCLISRDKSGVARLCSVIIEMSSYLGSYRPGLGRPEDPYAIVTYTKPRICTSKLLFIKLFVNTSTLFLTETNLCVHLCEYQTLYGWYHQKLQGIRVTVFASE